MVILATILKYWWTWVSSLWPYLDAAESAVIVSMSSSPIVISLRLMMGSVCNLILLAIMHESHFQYMMVCLMGCQLIPPEIVYALLFQIQLSTGTQLKAPNRSTILKEERLAGLPKLYWKFSQKGKAIFLVQLKRSGEKEKLYLGRGCKGGCGCVCGVCGECGQCCVISEPCPASQSSSCFCYPPSTPTTTKGYLLDAKF